MGKNWPVFLWLAIERDAMMVATSVILMLMLMRSHMFPRTLERHKQGKIKVHMHAELSLGVMQMNGHFHIPPGYLTEIYTNSYLGTRRNREKISAFK